MVYFLASADNKKAHLSAGFKLMQAVITSQHHNRHEGKQFSNQATANSVPSCGRIWFLFGKVKAGKQWS